MAPICVLVRHGEAAPGDFDEARPLTPRGRVQSRLFARQLAAWLEARGLTLVRARSSHLVRAVSTAELVLSELGGAARDVSLDVDPGLAPEGDPQRASERLEQLAEGPVLVVCHEPIIRGIARRLAGHGEPFATSSGLVIVEGRGVARLHPEAG